MKDLKVTIVHPLVALLPVLGHGKMIPKVTCCDFGFDTYSARCPSFIEPNRVAGMCMIESLCSFPEPA